MKSDLTNPHDAEIAAVRRYLENTYECRRYQLIHYFDPELVKTLPKPKPSLCCDVCARLVEKKDV